ncbi:hypothetical protein [Mesorhizobium sp. M3A.F.Ca.ET.175.01.1.1]|uniref:hypothetical protein n=2 Tax=Mesorhizobium TaxID=68287 RepID=UPI0032AF0783
MTVTRQDVLSVLGRVDDVTIAEIIAFGASLDELREAWAWAFGDEALMSLGRPLPGTRAAALIDLIEPDDEGDLTDPIQEDRGDGHRLRCRLWGTVRNSVREAMMMERRESSHGYRERTSGPVACRARPE